MGKLIDLDAYRRRKQRGLPRLATSRDSEHPAGPSAPDSGAPNRGAPDSRARDSSRLGLPNPPERPDDPDAPEPA